MMKKPLILVVVSMLVAITVFLATPRNNAPIVLNPPVPPHAYDVRRKEINTLGAPPHNADDTNTLTIMLFKTDASDESIEEFYEEALKDQGWENIDNFFHWMQASVCLENGSAHNYEHSTNSDVKLILFIRNAQPRKVWVEIYTGKYYLAMDASHGEVPCWHNSQYWE
jgi:hypothetical protein